MQRIASLSLASIILLTSATGCSWFGWGKKDKSADMYDPTITTAPTDTYGGGAYAPPMETGTTASTGGSRYHTVQKKETLCSISRQYYGSPSKWKDIYAANRSEIGDPNKIRVGQKLVIPQ